MDDLYANSASRRKEERVDGEFGEGWRTAVGVGYMSYYYFLLDV